MNPLRSGEPYGVAHLIERQMLLRHARKKVSQEEEAETPVSRYRFVTLSRDVGSFGNEIAGALAVALGWQVFDREILNHIAKSGHVDARLVEILDEKHQSLLHDTVQRLLRMVESPSFGFEEYHDALLKALRFLGTQGNAVLIGRGANFVLRGQPGLHVRITASPEVRVRRLAALWGVSPEEARGRMLEVDEERRQFIRHHYGKDLNDPRSFDVVFTTDFVEADQVTAAILAMLAPGRT